jgi:5'-nucleotidase
MRILLTNDDGIYADGIHALYQSLSKFADVTVVAPDAEQSSVGHGITLFQPLFTKKIRHNNKFFGYAVSGKPADCVKLAVDVILKKKPDLIISGINYGGNDGCSVFYSGTIAGAREGTLLGIDSIAISLDCFDNADFTFAAKIGARIAKAVYQHKLPKGTFLNVNVPPVPEKKIKKILMTRQGTEQIHGKFEHRQSPHGKDYYWMMGEEPRHRHENSIDTFALKNNYVTVTPVHCDSTDQVFLDKLKTWKL